MTRRQAWLIKAWAIWTLYVWGTRIWNIWQDGDNTLAFNIVHSVLALVSVAFAVLGWRVVRRVRSGWRRGLSVTGDEERPVAV